ncbi:hypothetical protein GCM10027176_47840 [Actinoallomurus bryophytorum]|uniref:Mce-associated membrane protein n=1 Tax=Actinoallomurus bryophytorum TaxID=1490222 RepID=A0A543CF70_9ACTN|nr:hypothetical protein [Actinoallomurus bryophytorum]TQL95753.1 hypothetical protein FB559_1261 [Actinoallomurus bryophytorum]
MDLTDRQRKLLFAGLVVVLAAAGVFLTIGGGSHRHAGAGRTGTPTPTATASQAGASAPPAAGSTPSPGSVDIYSLLPFSQKDFSTAADVARRFTAAYGTYRYDEDPATYVARLGGMATPDVATQIQQGAVAPGVLAQRKQDQEVSTSDATLDSLRDMAKDQFIFLVTGRQHITKGGKTSDATQQYAVTMTRSGGGWVVFAFAPADVGDK